MKLHPSTLKAWSRMKPPENVRGKAKLAWRRFALVRINGRPLAVPAKAACAWLRSVPNAEVALVGDTLQLSAGTSRIRLKCWAEDVPAEKPWDPRGTYYAPYQTIHDRVQALSHMAGRNL